MEAIRVIRYLVCVGVVLVCGMSSLAAQTKQLNMQMKPLATWQTGLPCAKADQVADLGFMGTECRNCTITGKHIAGQADIEFATEPILSGIRKGGPADGKLEERDVL